MLWLGGAPLSPAQTEESASARKSAEAAACAEIPVQASIACLKSEHQVSEVAGPRPAEPNMLLRAIRPTFLAVITASQLFGALIFFSYLDAAMGRSPLATLNTPQLLGALAHILIYLAGLIGSILIWMRKPAGLWLSSVHQLLMVPLFWVPGGFWVTADALGIAVVVGQHHINAHFYYAILWNLGGTTLLQVLNPVAGVSYYGANVFALICALYLHRLRRRRVFVAGEGG